MTGERRTVAVLGTGIIGAPLARNLAGAGLEVTAWNRTAEKAQALAGDGVAVADSPAAAVDGAAIAITMLTDGDAVRAVMADGGVAEAMADGAIWLQMSTIGVEATDEVIALAERSGVRLVDAPVSGTKQPAEEGTLTVLASGPDDALDECEPIFDAVGARTVRLGDAGSGTRMKLVVNSWLLAVTAGLAETFAVADSLGIDPRAFLEVIEGGPMDIAYAHMKGKLMVERDYPASFPLRLAAKDARLVLEAAEGLELPLADAARRRLEEAAAMGLADEDMAAVYEAASARDDRRPAAAA